MSDDPNPVTGDLVAALDQGLAAVGSLARLMAGYHRELVASGFSAEDALTLVVAYQRTLLRPEQDA